MIIESVNVATPFVGSYVVGDDFENLEILRNVDVHISGEKIEKIAPSRSKEEGKWVIPAFCDPHTHLVFCGSRENEIDLRKKIGYEGVLKEGGGIYRTVSDTAKCEEETLFQESRKRIISLMRNGTSTFEIKTGYGITAENEDKILRVIERIERELGITVKKTLLAHVPPKGVSETVYLKQFKEMVEEFAKRINYVDVFIDEGAFSSSFAREVILSSNMLGIHGRVHLNEIKNINGIGMLKDLKIDSYDHMLETREEEIEDLEGKVITVLPFTSFTLQKNPAIFRKMKERGIILAMGSDISPNTYVTSMPLIISLARQTLLFTLENLVNMTTLNAAYSLSLSESEGSIHPGKIANFILLKNKFSKLGYAIGEDPIEEVYIKGRPFRKSLEIDLKH